MRIIHSLITLCCAVSSAGVLAQTASYPVPPPAAGEGSHFVVRIPLEAYAMPQVHIAGVQTVPVQQVPAGAVVSAVADSAILTRIGMEKGRPFAVVGIPYYTRTAGAAARISSLTLDVTPGAAAEPATAARETGVSTSVLATGSWQKIAVGAPGVYRIDYDFIKNKLGKDPATINPGSIRLFGNGGAMLSENNAVSRPDDLREVAIAVADGGDNALNAGDYFVFYAPGPNNWIVNTAKDSLVRPFIHRTHLYEDSSYYFITFDNGPGLRIGGQTPAGAANVTVNTFDDRAVREEEKYNPGHFGKTWYGDEFSPLSSGVLTRTFTFDGPPLASNVRALAALAVRSPQVGSQFMIYHNNGLIKTRSYSAVDMSETATPVQYTLDTFVVAGSTTFRFDFTTPGLDGRGYLDFLEVHARRQLQMAGPQLQFRDRNSVGAGKVALHQLGNSNGNVQVWDVTDPVLPQRMTTSFAGGVTTFTQEAVTLHDYVAFDGGFLTPTVIGGVPNQNLHATADVDYIIVTNPLFATAAEELAAHHRQQNGLKVVVASTEQIYNEFSSGSQDISAIRDFARMFYKRAGTDTSRMPRYLLLFGDASYDYKDRTAGNTNYVPTFEAAESMIHDASYCVDDFFAFLDDNEHIENFQIANTLDVGVGRLPVRTTAEATTVVNKVKMYESPAALGPWRLNNTYVADNEDDAGHHLEDAEAMESAINSHSPIFNGNKVYLDNYNFIATPAGFRAPDANKSINDAVFKGTAIINYSGHGGPAVLAHERIVTPDDYNSWTNATKLPFMITATCDFSRYDQPTMVSSGERLVIKPNGGAIALLTTTQQVFAPPNREINLDFLNAQYTRNGNRWNTFGDAFRMAKNEAYRMVPTPSIYNYRAFSLMGDPALEPAFPEHRVQTRQVFEDGSGLPADSIKALGSYTIEGQVTTQSGTLIPDFNGRVYVTFYAKPRKISLFTKQYHDPREYQLQDNILYKGTATVTDGSFRFSFIAPKDLDVEFGKGRISYYAENGVTDAAGVDTNRKVGGLSPYPVSDEDAPIVRPYINDSTFRNGGLTGTNTLLYVLLNDRSGINVTGSSVGHDLTGVLDGDVAHPFILNDYYETFPNTYQRGFVRFPLTGLAEGRHTLTVKAWDVVNNSGEGTVEFVVGDKNAFQVQHLMNYPNPFSNLTHFVFEHNHPGEAMNAKIAIYSTDGTLVKLIDQDFTPDASRSREIVWDGTATSGVHLPSGVYPYRILLRTASGLEASAYQKVVIVR